MRTFNTLLVGLALVGFNGCGGGTSSDGGSTVAQNTLYTAFSSSTAKRLDMIYKTDGTATGTVLLDNSMLPGTPSNYAYENLINFIINGDILYSTREMIDANCGLVCTKEQQLFAVDLTTSTPLLMTGLEVSNNYMPNTTLDPSISSMVSSNSVYVRHADPLPPSIYNTAAVLSKVDATGTLATIPIPTNIYLNSYLGMDTQVGTDIYYTATYDNSGTLESKVVKLDTLTDTVSVVSALDGFLVISSFAIGTKLYIFGGLGVNNELHVYDTATPLVQPILVETFAALDRQMNILVYNDQLYFGHHKPNEGRGFYVLDATTNVVTKLEDITSQYVQSVLEYNNEIFFVTYTESNSGTHENYQLYKTNGVTPNSAQPVLTETIEDGTIYKANNKLYFGANTLTEGTELWQYDGTTASIVLDINTGPGSSLPRHITELNGNVVFQATQDGINNKLFVYDGTTLTQLN